MVDNILASSLALIVEHKDLNESQMIAAMEAMMSGQSLPEHIAAFLVGMRMKGITAEEMTGAVKVVRAHTKKVSIDGDHVIDIVGSGGDGAHLFNVSTASAFICSAVPGVTVAKYGNYGFSSKSGSADVLKAAGMNLMLTPQQVQECIKQLNIGFMLAQQHYKAGKQLGEIRKKLGVRTFMNLMGPLTNPADVKRRLVGVYDKSICYKAVEVLCNTGSEHVMVVHSTDGLDEISPAAPTFVVEGKNGHITEYLLDPKKYGINHEDLSGLSVKSPEDSLELIKHVLSGKASSSQTKKAADMLALNAGAALYIAGKAANLEEGINLAKKVIDSGAPLKQLEGLVAFTQKMTTSSDG